MKISRFFVIMPLFLGLSAGAQGAGLNCEFRGTAANGQSFRFNAKISETAEISVMPTGEVLTTAEQFDEWLEQHQRPGLPYDDTPEGQKNLLELMNDTILFVVEADWEAEKNKILHLAIYRWDRELSQDQGPVMLRQRNSRGSKQLALAARTKIQGKTVPISVSCQE
jgi:hypothetical protein